MKFLLWAIVIVIVASWFWSSRKAVGRTAAASKAGKDAHEPMVQCIHCGLHLPASESVTAVSGAVFCSDEHRLRHGA